MVNHIVAIGLVVTTCAGAASLELAAKTPQQPIHSVSWFMSHESEMRRMLAACRDDPAHANVKICTAAEMADDRIFTARNLSHLQ
jgi:hypothetical protein